MAQTATNVSASKPKIGGAIYRAPIGTTLPITATETLDSGFISLGYCSDEGITNSNAPTTEDVKAFGGVKVLNVLTEKPDTFAFALIEALNVNVLKAVYGDENVTGTLETGIKVEATMEDYESASWVIELVLRGGVLKRIVVPDAKLSELADIQYADNAAIGYGITLAAYPDANERTHYEYIVSDGDESE